MALTRREFLMRTGSAGGYSAAFLMMQSLGLMPAKASHASIISADPGAGKGKRVAILGAGVAGLVAAYELSKLGYECKLLESRERPGGRLWTARNGTKVALNGYDAQTCARSRKGTIRTWGRAAFHPSTAPCWAISASSVLKWKSKLTRRAAACYRTTR